MVKTLFYVFKTARPRQWIKNLSLFAALIFSGQFFQPIQMTHVFWAFWIFCGLSSATYLINDVLDAPRDRLHPFKKKRPVAAGHLDARTALFTSFGLIAILLPTAYGLSSDFFIAAVVFLLLQIAYSFVLKHIILVDVMAIAATFILRVYAGAWVISAHMNIWFLLCVTSMALFLAVGKRRSEITILTTALASKHRETLLHYPEALLHSLTTMFATATWVTYAMFAFLQPPIAPQKIFVKFFAAYFPQPAESKWLMISIPLVIYGVMRYLYLIYEKREGESPERVLLSDIPLLMTVLIWGVLVLGLIYLGGV